MNDLTPYSYRIYFKDDNENRYIPMDSGIDNHEELAKLFYSWEIYKGYEIYKIETIGYKTYLKEPNTTNKLERKFYE